MERREVYWTNIKSSDLQDKSPAGSGSTATTLSTTPSPVSIYRLHQI